MHIKICNFLCVQYEFLVNTVQYSFARVSNRSCGRHTSRIPQFKTADLPFFFSSGQQSIGISLFSVWLIGSYFYTNLVNFLTRRFGRVSFDILPCTMITIFIEHISKPFERGTYIQNENREKHVNLSMNRVPNY